VEDDTTAARAAQLELARACARGDAEALARFERELFGEIDAVRSRFRNLTMTRDELRQAMRDRLFVARDSGEPRIASYQGRGDLRAWVRMATTRFLVDVVRADSARPDRPGGDDRLADVATAGDDPELAFLKQKYRAEFRAAFAQAMASLDARDRNILRHRYLDGLEVNELATVYGMHRVSMSRALSRIRDELLAAIRAELLRRLGSGELDSIMALVTSQLELSLSRLLRP
jgi:RNA polymerase sigma-70 factor (ECF subfamily)